MKRKVKMFMFNFRISHSINHRRFVVTRKIFLLRESITLGQVRQEPQGFIIFNPVFWDDS